MTTTATLTTIQQRVLGAVGDDWRSTTKINRITGIRAAPVLNALYTRRFVDRREIETGRSSLEWRLEA